MQPEWARSIAEDCQTAGIPFMFKQWGKFAPMDGSMFPAMVKANGAKHEDRTLDGQEYNGIPDWGTIEE
jgi:protein gp37